MFLLFSLFLFAQVDSQASTSMIFNMRSLLFLSSLLPLILACDNPSSDACASAFTASSAAAASFCKTYTTATNTATTGLPAFVSSYCSTKTAKASSACSCLVTGAATTTATTLKTTTSSTTAVSFLCLKDFDYFVPGDSNLKVKMLLDSKMSVSTCWQPFNILPSRFELG